MYIYNTGCYMRLVCFSVGLLYILVGPFVVLMLYNVYITIFFNFENVLNLKYLKLYKCNSSRKTQRLMIMT